MRVGLGPIFFMMPSILFGPVYGAIVAALADLLGFVLRPSGAYLPLITLAVALGGFLRGGLWLLLRGKSNKIMRVTIIVITVLLLAFGLSNILFLGADGITAGFYDGIANPAAIDTSDMSFIGRLIINRTQGAANPGESLAPLLLSATTGLIGSGLFGLLLLGVDFLFSKRFSKKDKKKESSGIFEDTPSLSKEEPASRILPLLITILVSGLFVTTLNTITLRETIFTAWQYLPFVVVWAPRAIESIISNTIYVYCMALLLGVFERQRSLREIVR